MDGKAVDTITVRRMEAPSTGNEIEEGQKESKKQGMEKQEREDGMSEAESETCIMRLMALFTFEDWNYLYTSFPPIWTDGRGLIGGGGGVYEAEWKGYRGLVNRHASKGSIRGFGTGVFFSFADHCDTMNY